MAPETSNEIFALSSEIVDAIAALRPVSATYQGLPGHDHGWDDYSPAGATRIVSVLEGYLKRVRALAAPTGANAHWAVLATKIADELLRMEIDWFAKGDNLIDLNNIASSFQSPV